MLDFGILWNNARNLNYIKKFNNKKGIRLANNKLETKNFLSERGIPFAKTYGVINNRHELYDFDFNFLPKKNFVVKPNQWSKGQWVAVVKYEAEAPLYSSDSTPLVKKRKHLIRLSSFWRQFFPNRESHKLGHFRIGEELLSDNEFRTRLVDILDGKHSMTVGGDSIIVEEKLLPGELFKQFCEYGLADIRVIVFNLVPVATMIRVPTQYSHGKANLAQWGIGLGIEVWTGKVTSLLFKNRIYKTTFPPEFAHFQGQRIPYRNDILFLSSKVQYFVNLWYLALDWVITNEGPKLLEINARAGLEVQKVTTIKLKNVLRKIEDLNIKDPERGVEIAKTLFTSEKKDSLLSSKVLYLSQYGKLLIKDTEEETKIDVVVEVDLHKANNYISKTLQEKIKEKKVDYSLDLYENDIIFKKLKFASMENLHDNKIIIGNKTAAAFLIKPLHKTLAQIEIINPAYLLAEEKIKLQSIDQKVEQLHKRLNLSSRLRPTNYFSELDKFITLQGKYNPTFTYKWPHDTKLQEAANQIRILQDKLKKLKSPLKNLFVDKLDELEKRRSLILAYKQQDFAQINYYNAQLFGDFDEDLLKMAREKVLDRQESRSLDPDKPSVLGKSLKLSEIEDTIDKYLLSKKIYWVDIVFSYDTLSRISVIMGKEIRISISKSAVFKEKWLLATMAHEIDTHLVRYLNGVKSWWKIFKSWTAYYRKDEEGLAIWNGNTVLPDDYEKISMYKKYFLTKELMKYSFSKSADFIRFTYPERSMEGIFKAIIRSKRGIIDTSQTGVGYYKDKIYVEWYHKIALAAQQEQDFSPMYKGKIKLEDISFIGE